MIEKIVIVPIDDRPCHNKMITMAMANYDSINIVYPKKEDLGHFTRPGNPNKICSFVERETQDADVLIVSIDSLLFGGLVQARTAEKNVNLNQYDALLETLKTAKKNNPQLKVYAYSVIMRLTTTVTSSENLNVWEDIFEYSQLVHRTQLDRSFEQSLKDVEARIPSHDLQAYLNARQRNHYINKRAIQLTKDEIIDYLVLVQEDTSPYGMHISEQELLRKDIEQYQVNDSVVLKNGTDEMVALLLARHINKQKKVVNVDSQFVSDNFIALYEDTPVLDNLKRSLNIANMDMGSSKYTIFMLPCDDHKSDLCFEPWQSSDVKEDVYLNVLKTYEDHHIGLLDVKDANGGNPDVLYKSIEIVGRESLIAYSAWNTASNAIGTFLLDMSIAIDHKTNKDYLRHRILDDAIYQGKVRYKVNAWMKNQKLDVWAMNESEVLNKEVTRLMNKEIVSNDLITNKKKIKATLPWGRSFEIEMEDYNE